MAGITYYAVTRDASGLIHIERCISMDQIPLAVRWMIRIMLAGCAFYVLSIAWSLADRELGLDKPQS